MVSYHPDSRFITDFAAGTLPMSEATCVAAHLHYCGKCRARVQRLTDVGSHLFSSLEPALPEATAGVAEEDSFDVVMQRIETEELSGAAPGNNTASETVKPSGSDPLTGKLPPVLRKLIGPALSQMSWAQLGKALRIAPLDVSDESRETALYDIAAGEQMPEHEHRGEEITVLLKGSFSDADGKYSQGDFVVRNAGEPHQPTATQDTDCLCLISLERPVRARSLWYRLLEPLVQYRLSRTHN